jgi:hypothetical protein
VNAEPVHDVQALLTRMTVRLSPIVNCQHDCVLDEILSVYLTSEAHLKLALCGYTFRVVDDDLEGS